MKMNNRVNSIVIGSKGEVGSALVSLIGEHFPVEGVDLDNSFEGECDYLNICIPFSPEFVSLVNSYADKFKPALIINHSTVPVGTTKKINGLCVHSPVRGRHPKIKKGLERYIKYVGYNSEEAKTAAEAYLSKIFLAYYIENTDMTEFMKLASLIKYTAYLGIADEINKLSEKLALDYKNIIHWDLTQNEQVENFYEGMQWPLIQPPKDGMIGGHCCLPVSEMFIGEVKNAGVDAPILNTVFSKYKRD